jgi:phosphoribosylformimino-5-aminoimidazole carboxamide ribotide isomerase
MLIIPAIDIRGGNCVMLTQGKLEAETVYSKDPVFMAKIWQAKGAERLHVIDLDGAFQGMSNNLEVIRNIRKAVDIPIQVGGGVRNMKIADGLFEAGMNYVIVGTLAIYNPDVLKQMVDKYPGKIIVAVDVRDNKVAIGGWKDTTTVNALDLIEKIKTMGVGEIIITDIKKDGTLEGPNIVGLREIAKNAGVSIIASGGVSKIEDIKNLMELKDFGVNGVIVGKALYTEDVKLEDAIKIAKS